MTLLFLLLTSPHPLSPLHHSQPSLSSSPLPTLVPDLRREFTSHSPNHSPPHLSSPSLSTLHLSPPSLSSSPIPSSLPSSPLLTLSPLHTSPHPLYPPHLFPSSLSSSPLLILVPDLRREFISHSPNQTLELICLEFTSVKLVLSYLCKTINIWENVLLGYYKHIV